MHAYDPFCYCASCCDAEERLCAQIAAEDAARLKPGSDFEAYDAELRLDLINPQSGRR